MSPNVKAKPVAHTHLGGRTALLLKLSVVSVVTALSLGVGSAPVYAQTVPLDSNTAIHVQPVNMRTLHDQLNLTPDQEVQWQAALDAMRESHAAERMNADQMQLRMQALLKQPILDLSALHALDQKTAQQDAPLSGQSAKAWLTFYGSLNNQQKQTFSDAMRPQFENIAHHPARPYDPRTGL
ncbi:Spy/CpxP family protein refolding chaperone [Caballeronia sp. LZ043]|uniref:Spy/CpxP family protein refolding chaperone n=1 Tax=Caballeronia sp. LZ043 TaxID=3038569 RepID=UPI00285F9427|nr:Spy/CpxP family protein refolding chaperone [Caballeronia sp. LZ043]MDR5824307.1 Spy/CpxP family protein refolding chaperone [Caballeronia sp. LZ043]